MIVKDRAPSLYSLKIFYSEISNFIITLVVLVKSSEFDPSPGARI